MGKKKNKRREKQTSHSCGLAVSGELVEVSAACSVCGHVRGVQVSYWHADMQIPLSFLLKPLLSEETLTVSKTNYDGRRQKWRKKCINWKNKMPMCPVSVQVLFSMPNIIFRPKFKVDFIAANPLHAKTVTESWNWKAATQKKNWSFKRFKWKTTDMNLCQIISFFSPRSANTLVVC